MLFGRTDRWAGAIKIPSSGSNPKPVPLPNLSQMCSHRELRLIASIILTQATQNKHMYKEMLPSPQSMSQFCDVRHMLCVQSKGSAVRCSEGGAHKWLLLKYGVITLGGCIPEVTSRRTTVNSSCNSNGISTAFQGNKRNLLRAMTKRPPD